MMPDKRYCHTVEFILYEKMPALKGANKRFHHKLDFILPLV